METLQEVKQIVLGNHSLGYYLGGFFICLVGVVLSLIFSSRKRDRDSPNTPNGFSFLFLLWDNLKRAVASLLIMFIIFRTNKISNPWVMIGVGVTVTLAFDQVLEFIMSKSELVCKLLGMNRDKFPTIPSNKS